MILTIFFAYFTGGGTVLKAARVSSAAKGSAELKVVEAITAPGGVRSIPSKEDLKASKTILCPNYRLSELKR